MAKRLCDCGCGESLEGLHHKRRFFSDACRKASKRKPPAAASVRSSEPISTEIADRLKREFELLGVLDTYEAQTALGVAVQLDNRIVYGAAYVSLSKELDRRVDALRLKGDRPDSRVSQIREAVVEKQSHLRAV